MDRGMEGGVREGWTEGGVRETESLPSCARAQEVQHGNVLEINDGRPAT